MTWPEFEPPTPGDHLARLTRGDFKPQPIGTPTVIQEGDPNCEHDWGWRPIAVDDVDEVEQAKPGIAFPMATYVDELTCRRCKRIEVRNTRALL